MILNQVYSHENIPKTTEGSDFAVYVLFVSEIVCFSQENGTTVMSERVCPHPFFNHSVVERYVGDRYRVGLTNLGWHIARVCHSLACYIVIVINIMVIW